MTTFAQATPAVQPVLGIKFFVGSAQEAIDYLSQVGGYVVVPAAPNLVRLTSDRDFRTAVTEADMAIADSGFMVLLWRLMENAPITRISGLTYLKQLLQNPKLKERGQTYWVMPSEEADVRTRAWLNERGFEVSRDDTYLAPVYGRTVEDPDLGQLIGARRPAHIIIGIGGGPQEKLARYLRNRLPYRPAIHCIGAAIGFLTGDQVQIPTWADHLYLGWLFRSLSQPKVFVPRFWSARKLPWLIWKYREQLPSLAESRG